MDLAAARSFIFGAYLEDTAQKLAEARQREAFILVKGLILNILLVTYANCNTDNLVQIEQEVHNSRLTLKDMLLNASPQERELVHPYPTYKLPEAGV